MNWPIEAIHATMLPTGKVMVWQSWTQSVGLWDPETEQFSQPSLPDINIFCSSHAWLPDGRLMVVGGHIANNVGEAAANIYDPFTDSWAGNVAAMNAGRWYPSATTLGNGNILAMSGDISTGGNTNNLPQVYDVETNTWRNLTTAQKTLPLFPRTFLAPDGSVVSLSGNGDETERLDTSGTGQWSYLGQTLDNNLHNYGPAVMYDAGKVAYIGGGHEPTANISLIDLNDAQPQWQYGADAMAQPRRQNDATILADGSVLITGGSSVTGWNDPNGAVSIAEIWDPVTQQTRQVDAASNLYRGYHSTATLLPDGRVLVTGGDHDQGGFSQNLNAEIYSPSYLFNGDRPEVTLRRQRYSGIDDIRRNTRRCDDRRHHVHRPWLHDALPKLDSTSQSPGLCRSRGRIERNPSNKPQCRTAWLLHDVPGQRTRGTVGRRVHSSRTGLGSARRF